MAGWLLAKVMTSSGRSFVESNPPNVLLGHLEKGEYLLNNSDD